MIPNFTNSAPSPFPVDPREDHDPHDHHHFFIPNYQTPAASSSSVTYSVFFSPPPQDQPEYCHVEMHQDQPQREDANHALYTASYDPAEKKPNKGLKISLWKNSEINDHGDQENPVKWMSTKMRLMHKMKKSDITAKPEDHPKQPASSSLEADHFSSSNSSSNNSNTTPFRVCADCNTTRTPLWRSGPKGPKSLCNACGIRQRKARRAMAAAAAASGNGTSPQYETKAAVKIKIQNKEKVMKNNGQTTQFKKRAKVIAAGSSQSPHAQQKSNVFEDFLFNLSKKLSFHRVFPQDEKEAAILLMALSCGLVHG